MFLYEISNLRKFCKTRCVSYRLEAEDIVYSYEEIVQATELILRTFKRLKVPAFQCIALRIQDNKTPGTIVILLGILNHRCHFCPLEANAPLEDIWKYLRDSGARFLISNSADTHTFLSTNVFDHLSIFGENFYMSIVSPAPGIITPSIANTICYTLSTSGSTGNPKMVQVPYASIAPNIKALSERLKITPGDVIYLCSPLTFDPFVVEFFLALQNCATLLIIPQRLRFMPSKLVPLLFPAAYSSNRCGVTVLQMTPSMFRVLGVQDIRTIIFKRCSSLRVLLLGGEQFPTKAEWMSWLPVYDASESTSQSKEYMPARIFNIYGITEVSCWSTIQEYNFCCNETVDVLPIGQPLDTETTLRIVDSEGLVLSGAGQGELQIGSATRICHIPTNSETNNIVKSLVAELTFRSTGDLVQRSESGDIFYLGRTDSVVKRLGKRINLDALGLKIQDILVNKQIMVQVICLWDETTNKLSCCLSGMANDALNKKLIIDQLLDYEKPDRFVFLKSLALNSHGKIDRRRLKATLRDAQGKKCPADVLKSFLRDTLDLNVTETYDSIYQSTSKKRQKCSSDVSFIASGGTSFQGLSLATEIGQMLHSNADQRLLLEMLFNENVPLLKVLEFLEHVKTTEFANQTRFKELSTTSRKLKLLWQVDMDKCVDAAPAISDSCICIGSHSHLLFTLDATSGRELAQLRLPDRIECKVAFVMSSTMALVGCYDGHLYAFDVFNGHIMWRVDVGGMIKAQPLVLEGTVIVGSYATDFNLACICLKTHRIQWRCKVGDRGMFAAPLLMCAATVLACTLDGTFARIRACNGKIVWARKCKSPIFSSPALILNSSHLIVAEVSGCVHICWANSGEILHSFEAAGNIFSSITTHVMDSGNIAILFGCYDEHIYCLEYAPSVTMAKTQLEAITILWRFRSNASIYAMPTLLLNKGELFVVVCSTKGLLTILTVDDGSPVATYDVEAEIFSTPCSQAGDKIYFGCRDNFVYCLSFDGNVVK